jgi:hypothetical protein
MKAAIEPIDIPTIYSKKVICDSCRFPIVFVIKNKYTMDTTDRIMIWSHSGMIIPPKKGVGEGLPSPVIHDAL